MAFQKYVFTLLKKPRYANKFLNYGVYTTFKAAYEQIEKQENKAIAIQDKSELDTSSICVFEAVYLNTFYNEEYYIVRNLLTVLPNSETISYDMVKELQNQCEKKCKKYKYIADLF